MAAGCGAGENKNTTLTPAVIDQETLTPLPPSPTPKPIAASVNGEGILLSDFEEELLRLQSAQSELGISATLEEQKQKVINDLIEQVLLAQEANKNGYSLDDTALQAKIDELTGYLGSQEALPDWQTRNGYTQDSFLRALRRSLATAWQRDQIAANVSKTAEQVHARQILVLNADTAGQIYQQLQNGSNFSDIVAQYHPETRGELGWFPRGYLTQPAVEEAAFALQAGQYSQVIQTSFGYHIIQVVEREDARLLSPDALLTAEHTALEKWLEGQRANSEISILVQ